MGNNSGKKQCGDACHTNLDELFDVISNKKSTILRNDLKEYKQEMESYCNYCNLLIIFQVHERIWSNQIDQQLYASIESYLFSNQNELSSQTFKKFFLDICKGDSEQKIEVLCQLLNVKDEIPGQKLLQFVIGILNSILIIQESKSPKKFNSWNSRIKEKDCKKSLQVYANYFLNQTQKTENDKFTIEELRTILIHIDFFLHMVLSRLYDTEEKHFYTNVLPKWKNGPADSGRNLDDISVLDLCKITFLNLELPVDFQHEWRMLFSTSIQGESFSKLSGEIINKGPTIIIVKDKDDHIFGGFAPSGWSLGSKFFGDSRSFLFTLHPKMNLYVATNFNENYQYINVGQQTMPNGLGMGGRLEYFGMWLNAEFGKGYCSESCTTYRNYKMMSGTKEFEISHLEVWGVGPPPPTAAELGERSVLDGNLEAKAILEMAGKTAYSDGLREDIDN